MRTVVLGSAGQLGRDLCPLLQGEVHPLTRADVDLTDGSALRARLEEVRPDVVVNCAAYNFVDRAEAEPDAAFAVNAWAVRELAKTCAALGSLLVQVSTDYVFGLDPDRQSPYSEADAPGPVSVYGLSKLSGEYLVRSICPRHLIVRTCGLYGIWGTGGKGGNFVETMLRLGQGGKPVRVVDDQVCTPSFTSDIAAGIASLLQAEAQGVFHLVNAGQCTWYELARRVFELAGMQVDLQPITSAQFGAAARRPGFSVLSTEKFAALGLPALRRWEESLAAYLQQRSRRGA